MSKFSFWSINAAFIAFTVIIFSCTYSSHFPPKLNEKADTILSKIKTDNSFEEIEVQENKMSGTNGNHADITVKLYNGKNLPTDTTQLKKFGKDIAGEIKPALKEPAGINSIIVLFYTRVVDGNTTTSNYTGYEYDIRSL